MKILLDYHHHALFLSLYYLFKKRLGFEVYAPEGYDWYKEGYWKLYDVFQEGKLKTFDTTKCFLDLTHNKWKELMNEMPDIHPISLQEFKDSEFDLVLCSVPDNIDGFSLLTKQYQSRAKFIFQAGNNFRIDKLDKVRNLMSSATGPYKHCKATNKVFYHQEFDLGKFHPIKEFNRKSMSSFQHKMQFPELFSEVEKQLGWVCKSYGQDCRDGEFSASSVESSNRMKECGFCWSVKNDEGYGHVIHNAVACGKPVVFDSSYMRVPYDRTLPNTANMLLDGNTSIDIANLSILEICDKIRDVESNYEWHSCKVHDKFRNVVDFEKEFLDIKKFICKLI